MDIDLFGKTVAGGNPVRLEEVVLQLEPTAARTIAQFLLECADEMESCPHWEHRHLSEWHVAESGVVEGPDVVVFRAAK